MAVLVTRDWSKSQYGADSASEEYLITGLSDTADAHALVYDSTGFRIPQANESHPRNAALRVEPSSRIAQAEGFRIWRLPVRWSIPPGGGGHQDPTNPLAQPAQIQPGVETNEQDIDVDAYGNPIANAAGDAFEPALREEFAYITYTIRKNLPAYDPFVAQGFMNHVNHAIWTPKTPGMPQFPEGAIILKRWAQTDFVTPGADYYPCEFYLRLTGTSTELPPGALPDPTFRRRLLNQGKSGWYFNSERKRAEQGKLTIESPPLSGRYQEVSQDIRLQQDGRPFDLTRGVCVENGLTPIANPQPQPATVVYIANQYAGWLQFATKYSADFSQLPI